MITDSELLRHYVQNRSESAFTELVQRHVNLVYSAALRETDGLNAQAEDLAQAVFGELARQAPRLVKHPALAGWLYTTVRHAAANQRRADRRRQLREQTAQIMDEVNSAGTPDATWQEIRPLLDDAMHALNETDRTAVVLRFFEDRSLREVGDSLGVREDAARMRVDRALDKLREQLARRGVTSTASGLAAALAVGAVLPAPATLAASIASATLAGGATASATALTTLKIMSMTKIQVGIVGALLVAGVALPVWQQTRLNTLVAQNAEFRAQAAQVAPLQTELERLRKVDPAEVDRLRASVTQMQTELARLRGGAGEARRAKDEAVQLRAELAKQDAANGTNETSGAMGELMKSAIEQQMQGRLTRMKEKLHLTPEQAKAIEDIFMEQARTSASMMQKVMSGKMAKEDMAKVREAAANPGQSIEALLTPEQQTAYKELQHEETLGSARLVANSEVLQMQSALGLSQEQQDKMFAAIYDQTVAQLTDPPIAGVANTADVMQAMIERKLKALEPILNADQMEKYRQLQETQLKFIKNIANQMDPAVPGK